MSDSLQVKHFQSDKHRYSEKLLLNPPKHTQDEINIFLSELKKNTIKQVVELGSGNGRLTIPLLQNGIKVHAVDISKESLHALQLAASHYSNNKRLLSVSQTLPKEKDISAVVGCDILHHIDMSLYFRIMKSTLNNEGIIIFSEPNILHIAWSIFITLFLDWKIEWRIVFCNYITLKKLLGESGYKNISIKGIGLLPPPLFNWAPHLQKINYILGDLPILKLFAYRYIITAVRTNHSV